MSKRHVFYISDGTGLTAEAFGRSLITQFPQQTFVIKTFPFVYTEDKAYDVVEQIRKTPAEDDQHRLVFATLIDDAVRNIIRNAPCCFFDMFEAFLLPLEKVLQEPSAHSVGRHHAIVDPSHYAHRIEAIHYALATDDGLHPERYPEADLILTGVSRCGKTPTSLYLSMRFGLKVANYPLWPDDIIDGQLPRILQTHRHKLFGLTIDSQRLCGIRQHRTPNSHYADLQACEHDIKAVRRCFSMHQIPVVDSTNHSIEEIASLIMQHISKPTEGC